MLTLRSVCRYSSVPLVFGNQEPQYLDVIKQMLSASLTDQTSFDVRFMAVKASINYLLHHEKEANIHRHLADLLLPILTVTMESVEKETDEAALKSLIDLAESCPKFLRYKTTVRVFYPSFFFPPSPIFREIEN